MSTAEPSAQPTTVHARAWAELDPGTLYELLRLRMDVFVVEQNCPYPELDGRDVEPGTVHLWTADEHGPSAYLRVLDDGPRHRIGRVCTRVDARGQGLAAVLVGAVLGRFARRPLVLDAQAHLAGWYARFGFVADGAQFVEDGIAHVPMRCNPTEETP